MPLHPRALGLLALLLLASSARADIYKYYDKDGNLVLSDSVPKERTEQVEKLKLNPVMTVPALQTGKARRPVPASATTAQAVAGAYEIIIQSPAADATFQRAGGPIPVAFSVSPALREGHRVEAFLDGAPAAGVSELSVAELARGSHTLEVRVVDAEGRPVKTSTATFHIQQNSVLNPQRARPRPRA